MQAAERSRRSCMDLRRCHRQEAPQSRDQAEEVKPTGPPWLATAARIAGMGLVLLAGAWLLYFSLATMVMPHQIEYREGAAQVVTELLLEGRNPFAVENQPLGMTNYGILFSLTAWPLALVFGNTLILHRAITIAFLLLSAYVVARASLFAGRQVVLSLAAAILAAAALATRGGLGAYPSTMGAFFFLAATAVPYVRGFDRRGLLLSGVAVPAGVLFEALLRAGIRDRGWVCIPVRVQEERTALRPRFCRGSRPLGACWCVRRCRCTFTIRCSATWHTPRNPIPVM